MTTGIIEAHNTDVEHLIALHSPARDPQLARLFSVLDKDAAVTIVQGAEGRMRNVGKLLTALHPFLDYLHARGWLTRRIAGTINDLALEVDVDGSPGSDVIQAIWGDDDSELRERTLDHCTSPIIDELLWNRYQVDRDPS